MSYSAEMIEKAKQVIGLTKDSELIGMMPKCTKSIISEIKSGKRHLTEEQAIWIAEQCELDCALVLVELAGESAKTEKAQSAWQQLAKKLKAASSYVLLAAFLSVSGVSGQHLNQRIRSSP